jgi:hypothetical protein
LQAIACLALLHFQSSPDSWMLLLPSACFALPCFLIYFCHQSQGEDAPAFSSGSDSDAEGAGGGGAAAAAGKKGKAKLPKASLPQSLNWTNTTLEDALQLLALPRTVRTDRGFLFLFVCTSALACCDDTAALEAHRRRTAHESTGHLRLATSCMQLGGHLGSTTTNTQPCYLFCLLAPPPQYHTVNSYFLHAAG